jgi:hypothetical protein
MSCGKPPGRNAMSDVKTKWFRFVDTAVLPRNLSPPGTVPRFVGHRSMR